jgi:hypothetical protein
MNWHDLYGILWVLFVGLAAVGIAKYGFREDRPPRPGE